MTEISNYITNDYKAISVDQTIAEVQDFFEEINFSHFPVLDNTIYIGSISKEDLETFDADKKIADYKYTLEGFFARKNMIWLDVLEVFAKNHTNIVPVLDENNQYLGFYEMEEIIKFFHDTPFMKEKGGIIIVKKGILDYSMSQITQIVESNNGKILGVFVSNIDVSTIEISIKISLGNINEIVQSFRRYEYEILSEHQEDDYLNILKERSEYLEKYLSI
jgi:CBS domain containing-hemolysin-like protein